MSLDLLLHRRASTHALYGSDADQMQEAFGVSVAYLGLLFAVLASGCQSSDLPAKERELTSQVYGIYSFLIVLLLFGMLLHGMNLLVCCSYQCLRVTNFLSQPSIEAIQTLLIIGNVLSYNMNPGVSYVLLGKSDLRHQVCRGNIS